MILRIFLLQFILLAFNAQAQDFSYRHYSVDQGLPTSQVYEAVQDDEGFMWFGTDRGVVRFDGYEFEVFTTADGLPDNVVFHLFKDNLGRIWFATFSGELAYYEKGKIKPYQFNYIIEEELGHPLIQSFSVDQAGGVHFGLKVTGYFHIDNQGNYFENQQLSRRYHILEVDEEFIFYKFNDFAADYFRDDSTKLIYTDKKGTNNEMAIPFGGDLDLQGMIYEVKRLDESVLFTLGNGLYQLKNNVVTSRYQAETKISEMLISEGGIWISAYNSGFTVLDANTFEKSMTIHLNKHTISDFYKDSEGAVWITTLNNGIYYLADHHHTSLSENKGLVVRDVFSMASNGKKLLISDTEGTMCWVDMKKDSTYLTKEALGEMDSPKDIYYFDDFECFFFMRNFSLNKLSAGGHAIKHANCRFFVNYQDTIFAINYTGDLNCSEIEGIPIYFYNIGAQMRKEGVRTFFVNENLKLIGGVGGIQEIIPRPNEKTDSIFFWKEINPIYNVRVVQIEPYNGFDFIAATRGEGILFVRDKIPYVLKKKQGLLSNQITCLFVDSSQTIWAGTSNGLSVISKEGDILNLRIEDGLISNEITAVYANGEKVYVGTKKGLTILNRDRIFRKKRKIPVVFKSIRLESGEKPVSNSEVIDMSYKEPFLEVEFTGISYRSKGRIKYKYRLNADENWQYTTINRLLFNNLAPGVNNLEIFASNGENDWSDVPATLQINVSYPFWLTSWFFIIALLGVLLLLILIYKLGIRRVKRREKIERQIQNLRFEALSAQMNPHFIFNSLNSIQNFIMQNEKKASIQYLSKFAKLMRKTLDHSRDKNITLTQELEALVLYLDLEILRFGNQISYDLEIDTIIDTQKVILPALLIQPIVENAILHGLRPKEGLGYIQLRFLKMKNQLVIIIEDNGVGRNIIETDQANKEHQSQGSLLTEERVMLFSEGFEGQHGYVIADLMIGEQSVGTRVIVKIPYILNE